MTKWVLLSLALFIPLTFFMHLTEVRMTVLEIGTNAPYYVISQTDFSFLDQEATQALKQEAARDIGDIYRIRENAVIDYRHGLEHSLIEYHNWRQELPRTTFEEIYLILDQIQEALLQDRLTDERTLQKIASLNEETSSFFVLDLQNGSSERVQLPSALWQRMKEHLLQQKGVHLEAVDYLISFFKRHDWPLQHDFTLQDRIQQAARSQIQDRFTHVDAGLQIVKKGEVVTARHITMLHAMKAAEDRANDWWNLRGFLGSAIFSASLILIGILHLYFFHRHILHSFRKAVLLVLIFLMSLALAKGIEHLFLSLESNLVEVVRFPFLMPFPALLVSILIGIEAAVSVSFFLLIIFGTSLAVDTIPFLLMNFFAAVITIFFARKVHRRRQVFSICGKVFLSLIPVIFAMNLFEGHQCDWNFTIDLISSFGTLLATAVLAIILLPILESAFHVMTDMTLMEYMDPDNELLKRLSLEAPGTYQHSLVVGHIAEAAARAVSANGLFCRAATLYHDIGKLFNPHYFTENQLGGFNIHQLLTPVESTQVIIAHVVEGEVLARKHGLPQSFIDIIREHHGTTLVYYFYCKQVEQMDGDVNRVDEREFRYPGPKPRSKESAIIMIADTVEAASRSLGEITEPALRERVDKLVAKKADDGQFDECELTFEELGRVKKAVVKALIVTSHLRIKYPD